MSGSPDDERLEELRQKKMEQLQDRAEGGQGDEAQEAAQQQAEAQKNALLRQYLTDDARKRLNTVKMSKPQFGEQVERQVVTLARSGRIQGKIDDDKMKQLLKELQPDSKSFDIQRR
ncbi:DNA-binding protein [Natrinema hispanicum]|jgi:programmed cell death protein 5|uniref:DNA-binding protein BDK88_0491 n=1 Tax=Natrinema hispanicum TaxID=392421 RepID=A0A1G6L6R8_9EURY|nr:DNA-binding protein [Natrinema hispanicum]RZV11611.1 DNA-binding TFAR19-related protein [Natrinema hispanicum]SDC38326.1 DNA-binding TFAR19-related protein [Natrinema hispanicum]SET02183.1 DNA-binding TFAR19-related protein [Natrinema hispanicum]